MDFLDLAKARYSCRNYLAKEVEEDKIKKILEAARLAPSACNNQPLRIIITKDNLKELEITKFDFKAPLTLICLCDTTKAWTRRRDNKNYGVVDTTLAMMQMMLEATNLGLATCFIGAFDEAKIKSVYNLGDNLEVVGLLSLGYSNDSPSPMHSERKDISELLIK